MKHTRTINALTWTLLLLCTLAGCASEQTKPSLAQITPTNVIDLQPAQITPDKAVPDKAVPDKAVPAEIVPEKAPTKVTPEATIKSALALPFKPILAETKPVTPTLVAQEPDKKMPVVSKATKHKIVTKPVMMKSEPIEPKAIKPVISAAANNRPADSLPVSKALPFEFQLEQLPLTIDDRWVLASHTHFCTLSTLTFELDDGQGPTTIQLQLSPDNWTLFTQSDIDMSYPNTGLTVDGKVHFALEHLNEETNIVFKQNRSRMIDAFIHAQTVEIALGFWPTWPVTRTKKMQIAVNHFERAYLAWKQCQLRINAR